LLSIRHPFVSFSTAGVIHSEKSSAVQMAAAIHSKKKKQPSQGCCYVLEKNIHPFERQRLSVRKKCSAVERTVAIHS